MKKGEKKLSQHRRYLPIFRWFGLLLVEKWGQRRPSYGVSSGTHLMCFLGPWRSQQESVFGAVQAPRTGLASVDHSPPSFSLSPPSFTPPRLVVSCPFLCATDDEGVPIRLTSSFALTSSSFPRSWLSLI